MNKKIKNILSVGAITILTASSVLPVNAFYRNTKRIVYTNVYMYVNGVKFELPLTLECPDINCKPQFRPCGSNNHNFNNIINNSINNNTTIEHNNIANNKPNTTIQNNNHNTTTTKPNTNSNNTVTNNKPNTTVQNNNNNTTINKPNTNLNNNIIFNKHKITVHHKNNTTTTTKPNTNSSNNSTNNNTVKPDKKPATTNTNFSSYQQQVLDLVNKERTSRGLSPLTLDSNLCDVATKKAQDMATKNYFDHTSPTYGSPFDMMSRFGVSYRTAGENIAKGQKTPEEVMNAWMNSPGHRANILNPDFTKLGLGVAKDSNGTLYWSQMFIG